MTSPGYSFDEVLRFHQETTLETWDDGGEVMRYAFLHMPEFFPHAVIHRDGPIAVLGEASREDVARYQVQTSLGRLALDEYVQAGPVNGVVVLHRGAIVYERYPRMRPFDLHLLMSVSKVFTSTLIAILEDRGLLDSRQPVESYLPEARGSGWEGVAVRDVLDMASGIDCDETVPDAYTNPAQPNYQFEASLGWQPPTADTPGSTYDFIAALKRAHDPGQVFNYASANTFLLGWLAERVTGRAYADLLSELIWRRIGAEGDALIAIARHGATAVHGGIYARLRDVARFGLLFTPSWHVVADESLISERYLREIHYGARPDIFARSERGQWATELYAPASPPHNSYQWDFVVPGGPFYKGGYGGQVLLVEPGRDLVVAAFGTFDVDGRDSDMRWIAYQLAVSDLFTA